MQSLINSALQTATSGLTIEIRVGERMQRFEPRPTMPAGTWSLGFGSPLSRTAAGILDKYRRRMTPSLIA
jgi:hypothetical protein